MIKQITILLAVSLITCSAIAQDVHELAKKPSSPAAVKKAANGAKAANGIETLEAAAAASIVTVNLWYKKNPAALSDNHEDSYKIDSLYTDYIFQKKPAQITGVVLDDKGTILISDGALHRQYLDKIEVVTRSGKVYQAELAKLLDSVPGAFIKVKLPAGKKNILTPLAREKKTGDTTLVARGKPKLYEVFIREVYGLEQWTIHTKPMEITSFYHASSQAKTFRAQGQGYYFGAYNSNFHTPSIVGDSEGNILGCSFGAFNLDESDRLWKLASLIKAKGVTCEDLEKQKKEIRESLLKSVHEIVFKFRKDDDSSSPSRFSRERYSYNYDERTSQGEREVLGIAIASDLLFIPDDIPRQIVAKIDTIKIRLPSKKLQEVEFVGAYKSFGGFVVRFQAGKFHPVKLATKDLSINNPILEVALRKKFSKKDVKLTRRRISGKLQGYAGKYHWFSHDDLSPSLLVDTAGCLAGIYALEKNEGDEQRKIERSDRYYRNDENMRIFSTYELQKQNTFSKPALCMDSRIVIKKRILARRIAWFGAQFTQFDSNVAEHFKVSQATREGEIGLVISVIYPASPAKKLGLEIRDILLSVKGSGKDDRLVELSSSWTEEQLNKLLDGIGIGKTVTISYLRPDQTTKAKVKTIKYKIVRGPAEFESSPKWKNTSLGLTVKDLTYKIRFMANLTPQAPGVVVADFKDGSATSIARIYPGDIITHLDEIGVTTAKQMRNMIASAAKAGKTKVRLTVFSMGKTRLADLTISAYDPKKDEGIDEDLP